MAQVICLNGTISLSPVYTTNSSSADRACQHRMQYWTVNTDRTILGCRTDHLHNFTMLFILKPLAKPAVQTFLNGRCSNTQKYFFPSTSTELLTSKKLCQLRIFQYKQSFYFYAWRAFSIIGFTVCCTVHFHTVSFPPLPQSVSVPTCRKRQIAKGRKKKKGANISVFLLLKLMINTKGIMYGAFGYSSLVLIKLLRIMKSLLQRTIILCFESSNKSLIFFKLRYWKKEVILACVHPNACLCIDR